MNIAIIGAGFTGLAAAWDLRKGGHTVTIFEANAFPGGLAAGFRQKEWEWSVEHHYHHIFRSDKAIQELIQEMDLEDLLFFSAVKTSTRYEGHQFRLDSPMSLLLAPVLSVQSKLRTAATLAFLKLWPFWRFLDSMTAQKFIIKTMGQESWKILWEPLFIGKFGKYASDINAAWFWSRIHVRSAELGYFRGGFLKLAEGMTELLKKEGTTFQFETPVSSIERNEKKGVIEIRTTGTSKVSVFDQVLVTSPAPVFAKIVHGLSDEFKKKITSLKGLAAVTLVLELDTPFFADKSYWLNINEQNWPFLAVVEHTQFTGTHPYNNKTILFVGKYLENTTPQYSMSKVELLKLYQPFLEKLSPHFEHHITNSWLFHAPFAQPIVEKQHQKLVPSVSTPIENVYWSSMQHVYPWDRGTNYAVALGRRSAQKMMHL
ncbi:MAG: FAD-dependent oxidoreductase [Patescibacteria group bacterium]